MARGRRKVNIDTLDAKIEQQKAALEKVKAKYEAEKETLAELIKRKRYNSGVSLKIMPKPFRSRHYCYFSTL